MNTSKLELWNERIQECRSSGLTVSQWCYNNHLTKAKYYYWHKVINESVSKPAVNSVFAEVLVKNNVLSSYHGIKISCKNVEIALSSRNDISLAVELIHELQRQC